MNPRRVYKRAAIVVAATAALAIHATSAAANDPVPERSMVKYCQGEASGRFEVNPRDIAMLPLERRDNGAHSAFGQYPPTGQDVTTFECRFGVKGRFRWVRTTEEQKVIHEAQKTPKGEPSDRQIRACNAVEDNYGKVVEFSPLKPGAFEIILDHDDGAYVCDVEENGKVTYFEKLN